MKTVYIPKGESVSYESLDTENLIVKGALHVERGVRCKNISGGGIVTAGSISSDTAQVAELESANITCKRLIAKRVFASEVIASESAAVSEYLTAALVRTGKLTVALHEIGVIDAQQVINLPIKNRSLFGTLLASALRTFWLSLVTPKTMGAKSTEDIDSVEKSTTEEIPAKEPVVAAAMDIPEEMDFELQRIITQFRLARESGYTLRLIPGTPEENAPTFDFETGQILRPVA